MVGTPRQWRASYTELFCFLTCFVLVAGAVPSGNWSSVNPKPINETTPYEPVQGSDDGQLSWQSAFWALVTIALATMADAPGSVHGYPRELTFYLKISPLTCLTDVLGTLFEIGECLTRPSSNRSHREMIYLICKRKMNVGSSGATDLPRSPIRFILFLFGALPQALKLIACRGVLETQVLAACYLSSFVADELMLLVVRMGEPNLVNDHVDMITRSLRELRMFCYNVRIDVFVISVLCWSINMRTFPKPGSSKAQKIMSWSALIVRLSVILIMFTMYITWCIRRRKWYRLGPDTRSESDTSRSSASPSPTADAIVEPVISLVIRMSMMCCIVSMALIAIGGEAREGFSLEYCVWVLLVGLFDQWLRKTDPRPYRQMSYVKRELDCISGVLSQSAACLLLPMSSYLLNSTMKVSDMPSMVVTVVSAVAFTVVSAIALCYFHMKYSRSMVFKSEDGTSHSFPLITYCSLITLALIADYRWNYDAGKTYKPAWTEWLG